MPSAGAIPPPHITALSQGRIGRPLSNNIDSATYIDLTTDSPFNRVYFTTDGTKPSPFQRFIGGREITFKYKAPFTLKPGKRVLKAIAVARDGLLESAIVSKTYHVEEAELCDGTDSQLDLSTDRSQIKRPSSAANFNRAKSHNKNKNGYHAKNAWTNEKVEPTEADSGVVYGMPDQPFHATNYSGTQVNIWGVPPQDVGGLMTDPAKADFSKLGQNNNNQLAPYLLNQMNQGNQNNAAIGMLAQQMMQKIEHDRQATVADIRQVVQDNLMLQQAALPAASPAPAIDILHPPLKPTSPGDGQWKEQICHIYSHLQDHARGDSTFRKEISKAKMTSVAAAKFHYDEPSDSFILTVRLDRSPKDTSVTRQQKNKDPTRKPRKGSAIPAPPVPVDEPEEPHEPEPEEAKEKDPEPYFVTEDYEQEATLKPYPNMNVHADCEALRKAMKGFGTDEKAIIDVLAKRSVTQRLDILKTFKSMFGKDLIRELKSELSGNFLKTCLGLLKSPADYDASELRRAMKGLGTDEDVLIEIICTRTNAQIVAFTAAYKKLYNRNLEEDIMSETSGHYKRLLVSLLQANRDEGSQYDQTAAEADAKELHEAGEKKWGTDESRFNVILCQRSYAHLRAVFDAYSKLSKKDIEDAIKSEMSGDLSKGMLSVVRCIRNKPGFFARVLHKAMKGLGTDDDTLLRVIVCRCECDMVQIKENFQTEYKDSLAKWIKDDTSGDYRATLLTLIGEPEK